MGATSAMDFPVVEEEDTTEFADTRYGNFANIGNNANINSI